ncbi:hypothetical protein AB9E06_21495 [Rhizobium leguminosarum]|uniref:hypothetical protein n=1 Tax=Rhizobium leguminosarum TaxID=384 RepID=UPI003F96E374
MNPKIKPSASPASSSPVVKAAFERSERDNGAALAVPAPRPPRFIAGASLQWRRNLEALELA